MPEESAKSSGMNPMKLKEVNLGKYKWVNTGQLWEQYMKFLVFIKMPVMRDFILSAGIL